MVTARDFGAYSNRGDMIVVYTITHEMEKVDKEKFYSDSQNN